MEDNRLKLVIIVIAGIAVVSLFFAFQLYTGKQSLLNEYNMMRKDLSEKNDALAKRLDSMQRERQALEEKFGSIQKDLDNLSKDRDDWKQKYEIASQEKEEVVEKLEKLAKKQKEAPSQPEATPGSYLAQVLKEKAELEVEVASLKNSLSDMQLKVNEVNETKKELDLQLSKLMQDKQDLERQFDYNKDYSEKVIQKLSADAARESKDKETILKQLNEIRSENASIRAQLKFLTSDKINLEKKLRLIDEEKQGVESRLISLNQSIESKLEDITDLKEDLNNADTITKKSNQAKAVELPPIVVSSSSNSQVAVSGGKIITQSPEGKILSINKENNFVIVDIGQDTNIQKGSQLGVYRLNEKIGDIEIVQVRKNISAADIKQVIKPFRVGDIIK